MKPDFLKEVELSTSRKRLIITALILSTLLLSILCILAGSSGISFIEVVKAILRIGDSKNILIVYNIRLPRVLAAIICGAALALSGTIMQAVLKNPMASPSTLGVSNAAVFGANFAIIVLGAGTFHATDGATITIDNPYVVSTFAFLFAGLSIVLILLLAKLKHFSCETIILAGIAVGAIFQAATTIIQYFSEDSQVSAAVYWSFGNLSRATYKEVLILFVLLVIAFIYFMINRWKFSAIAISDEVAISLGVNAKKLTNISLLFASLLTAISVSFFGIIGFIGLIAPQIMKRFVGEDYRILIPSTMLTGSCVLLLSDTIGRILIKGIALPVGAITSLFGGPLFIYILLHERKYK